MSPRKEIHSERAIRRDMDDMFFVSRLVPQPEITILYILRIIKESVHTYVVLYIYTMQCGFAPPPLQNYINGYGVWVTATQQQYRGEGNIYVVRDAHQSTTIQGVP